MRFDYTNIKEERKVRMQAKKDLTELFYSFLEEKFGKDKRNLLGYVDKNTIGLDFADVLDKDGFPCGLVATITPIIKGYNDINKNGKTIDPYDLQEEIDCYKEFVELKIK